MFVNVQLDKDSQVHAVYVVSLIGQVTRFVQSYTNIQAIFDIPSQSVEALAHPVDDITIECNQLLSMFNLGEPTQHQWLNVNANTSHSLGV